MSATARAQKPLWIRFASRAAGLLGIRFYNMLYGERALSGTIPLPEVPTGLKIRPAEASDLEQLQSTFPPPQAEACRLAAGQQSRCLIAVAGQEIAGYSWLNTRHIYLLSWRVQGLSPNGGYTYNSFVRPEFRGRKIFQCLTVAVYSELESAGFRYCCNLVDRSNAPSVAARRRLGAEFHAAPILKLPGLDPVPLWRLPLGVTTRTPMNPRG